MFDFINGFHDAANSIATVVSTRVLSPVHGGRVGGVLQLRRRVRVRDGRRQDDRQGHDRSRAWSIRPSILAGLLGAIVWDLITWWWGLPTSSSHALMGGYAGAAVAKAGYRARFSRRLDQDAGLHRRVAPVMGLTLALAADGGTVVAAAALDAAEGGQEFPRCSSSSRRRPTRWATARTTRRRRWASSSALLFSPGRLRGLPDPGVFTSTTADKIPIWVILAAHAAIALGTMAGGWRIVKTMGQRITKLRPFGGFCAETSGGGYALRRVALRHSGQHHAHHHGRHHRRGGRAARCRRCAGGWRGGSCGPGS